MSNFAFWDGHVKWMIGSNVSSGENSGSNVTGSTTINGTPQPTYSETSAAGNCTAGGGPKLAAGTQGAMANGSPVVATFSIF